MVAVYVLATADVVDTDRTEVSWWSMSAILALMILCDAGIVGIAPGFGFSVHSFHSSAFLGIQVVLT